MDRNAIPVEWLKKFLESPLESGLRLPNGPAIGQRAIVAWQRECDEKDERASGILELHRAMLDCGIESPWMFRSHAKPLAERLYDKLCELGWVKYTVGVDTGTGTSKSVVHAVVSASTAAPQPTDETLAKELADAYVSGYGSPAAATFDHASSKGRSGYLAEAAYVRKLIRRAERDARIAEWSTCYANLSSTDRIASIRAEYADVED